MITSYHQHSAFSDGKGTLEECANAAVMAGITALGFSDHAPLPFETEWTIPLTRLPEYRAEVHRLRALLLGRLEIYLGLELDYLPEAPTIAFQRERVLCLGWDYIIGSIHYLGREAGGELWSPDVNRETFERGLSEIYHGDIRAYCDHYYATVRDLARDGRFTIMGHLDYTKRFNDGSRYYSDEALWYRQMIDQTLVALARAGMILELNTGGWRSPRREAYPAPFILRRAHELGLRVTVNADAHRSEDVALDLDRGLALIQAAGYRQVARLLNGRWRQQSIEAASECGCPEIAGPAGGSASS
jgi:histidinol-phosphatase (PHP family)